MAWAYVTEDEVQGKHAGFRLRGRSVGGRQDHEVDIAGLHLLHRLRFGAELRARILVDRHRALAELLELLVEHGGADAVAALLGLVVGERELALLRNSRRNQRGRGGEQNGKCQ